MTKHNADNTGTANDLAEQARDAAERGVAAMRAMNAASAEERLLLVGRRGAGRPATAPAPLPDHGATTRRLATRTAISMRAAV